MRVLHIENLERNGDVLIYSNDIMTSLSKWSKMYFMCVYINGIR